MQSWISEIKEGESAFDNKDHNKIPHKKVDGLIIYNANKNGDKYKRQYWDKVAPCIHTRNDILSSQNTVHPIDDRVFSIREVMLMMSVPNSFKWTKKAVEELNKLSIDDKKQFLKKEEMNIRHCLGDNYLGVPLKGRAFRSNLFFVPQKRISTSIPNAKLAA